jgi:hypothetical protein
MFNISLISVVNKIVEHELIGKGPPTLLRQEALHFHLDLRMSYYGKNEVFDISRGLHLLYYVRPGYSYPISVFSAITSSPFTKAKEVNEWKHEVTHDSCWRDIRTITELYFQMADQILTAMGEEGKSLAPKDMHEHNGFALFGPLYDWIPVEVKKDLTDPNNYRKTVILK